MLRGKPFVCTPKCLIINDELIYSGLIKCMEEFELTQAFNMHVLVSCMPWCYVVREWLPFFTFSVSFCVLIYDRGNIEFFNGLFVFVKDAWFGKIRKANIY